MDLLNRISLLMTGSGLALVAIAWIMGLDQIYILIGVLLAWAGFVKIAVVAIWTKIAMIGSDDHRPVAGP